MDRILVVDDYPGIRSWFARVLTNAGYPVSEASITHHALKVLRKERCRLILLDIASSLSAGATVQAGDIVGRIANVGEGPHRHLNEIHGIGSVSVGGEVDNTSGVSFHIRTKKEPFV